MDYQDQNPFERKDPIPVHDFTVEGAPNPPHKKNRTLMKVIALCLVCALVGGLVGAASPYLANAITGGGQSTLYTGNRTPTELRSVSVDTQTQLSFSEIYSNYVNSTVGITVDIVTTNVFGQTVKGAAAGSGFVITEDGYIVTNYHVISDANSITVTFADGKSYPATLVGGEEGNDIAVIKIDAKGLTPVVIGNSDNMRVGESVAAIGNPLGELTFSMTAGVISALNRSITMSDGTTMNMIQTDSAINSGNSGGPLFNQYGEVIGIVSAKYSSSSGSYSGSASVEGLGFAIPINDVADMIHDLIDKGYVTGKPYLGLVMNRNGVDSSAQAYGIPAGVQVLGVTEGLSADKAGIKANDIITAVDGAAVSSSADISNSISKHKPGDTVEITVYRSGETLKLSATLVEATQENVAATSDLSSKLEAQQQQESQQNQQQQEQNNGGSWGWPFGGGV